MASRPPTSNVSCDAETMIFVNEDTFVGTRRSRARFIVVSSVWLVIITATFSSNYFSYYEITHQTTYDYDTNHFDNNKRCSSQCILKLINGNGGTVADVCQCLSCPTNGLPVVNSIWNSEFIKEALRKTARESLLACWHWEGAIKDMNATETEFAKVTDRMIHLLNSYNLRRSLKTHAHPFVFEKLVEVVIRHLVDPVNNPPLKIAVFGGSVTEGVNSMMNSMGLKDNAHCPECAWPSKLGSLLNHILGSLSTTSDAYEKKPTTPEISLGDNNKKIVSVKNFALGGTNSEAGSALLEYNLYGLEMAEYDIIIAAFGANDIQAPMGNEGNRMYESMQRFMRLAKSQRPCNDLPLVIQLDDVLGDSVQESGSEYDVRGGLLYSREMIETNNWAGFMSVSYADAVRDIVYGNPKDMILHNYGNLHPGFNFHTGVAWVLGYNFIEGMVDACTAANFPEHDLQEPRAGFPPPVLLNNLRRDEAVFLWKKKAEEQAQLCAKSKAQTFHMHCVYNWVAGRHNADTADAVYAAVSKVATSIKGWKAIGYPIRKPRRTWIATGLNSTFTIQLDSLKEPINRMMVMVIHQLFAVYHFNLGVILIFLFNSFLTKIVSCFISSCTWLFLSCSHSF